MQSKPPADHPLAGNAARDASAPRGGDQQAGLQVGRAVAAPRAGAPRLGCQEPRRAAADGPGPPEDRRVSLRNTVPVDGWGMGRRRERLQCR